MTEKGPNQTQNYNTHPHTSDDQRAVGKLLEEDDALASVGSSDEDQHGSWRDRLSELGLAFSPGNLGTLGLRFIISLVEARLLSGLLLGERNLKLLLGDSLMQELSELLSRSSVEFGPGGSVPLVRLIPPHDCYVPAFVYPAHCSLSHDSYLAYIHTVPTYGFSL